MGDILQNTMERLKDKIQKNELTIDQAHVELVRTKRVHLVIGPMPQKVRKVLNEAVKRGELAHLKKDGHKPECYYHPSFDYLAHGARKEREDVALRALAKVYGFDRSLR